MDYNLLIIYATVGVLLGEAILAAVRRFVRRDRVVMYSVLAVKRIWGQGDSVRLRTEFKIPFVPFPGLVLGGFVLIKKDYEIYWSEKRKQFSFYVEEDTVARYPSATESLRDRIEHWKSYGWGEE